MHNVWRNILTAIALSYRVRFFPPLHDFFALVCVPSSTPAGRFLITQLTQVVSEENSHAKSWTETPNSPSPNATETEQANSRAAKDGTDRADEANAGRATGIPASACAEGLAEKDFSGDAAEQSIRSAGSRSRFATSPPEHAGNCTSQDGECSVQIEHGDAGSHFGSSSLSASAIAHASVTAK
jgi:hypothetical protein